MTDAKRGIIATLLLAPVVISASGVGQEENTYRSEELGTLSLFPKERITFKNENENIMISHKNLIKIIKKNNEIDENEPLEIKIHEESSSIDVFFSGNYINISIREGSTNPPNADRG